MRKVPALTRSPLTSSGRNREELLCQPQLMLLWQHLHRTHMDSDLPLLKIRISPPSVEEDDIFPSVRRFSQLGPNSDLAWSTAGLSCSCKCTD